MIVQTFYTSTLQHIQTSLYPIATANQKSDIQYIDTVIIFTTYSNSTVGTPTADHVMTSVNTGDRSSMSIQCLH